MRFGENRPAETAFAPFASRSVFSSFRITLENNEKIRQQPDRENAFAAASGGAEGTGVERSPIIKRSIGKIFKDQPHVYVHSDILIKALIMNNLIYKFDTHLKYHFLARAAMSPQVAVRGR